MKTIIGPSVLNTDLSCLACSCQQLIDYGADELHLDIMDGHFVSEMTFGPIVLASLSKYFGENHPYFDVHLMVDQPAKWISSMAVAGANRFTFHVEPTSSAEEVKSLCTAIKNANMHAGIAIKPDTPVNDSRLCFDLAQFADVILVMTVEPGKGGQQMIPSCLDKVRDIRARYPTLNIQVDGGIGLDNVSSCANAGANMIVSGTSLLRQADKKAAIEHMRSEVKKAFK